VTKSGNTIRRVGWAAALAAGGLALAAGAVYPAGVGGLPEWRGVIVAGNLLTLACAPAAVAAVCLFLGTPPARRYRPVLREARTLVGHVVCGVFLLLCAGVCVLWAASHQQAYAAIFYNGARVDYVVMSQRNSLHFGAEPRPAHRTPRLMVGDATLGSPLPARRLLRIPHAVLALAFALPPVIWFVRRRRAARADAGLCPACGYDLRASEARCPECGETVARVVSDLAQSG
jgi:hypothetical protein